MVKIFLRGFTIGGGHSEWGAGLDGGDGGVFSERHSFVGRMKILGGKGWRRDWFICASMEIWDDGEFLRGILLIPKVVTNLDFEKVSTMPLELRGGLIMNVTNKLKDGSHTVKPGDTYRNAMISSNWRQFTPSQKLILNDVKLSKVSVDKVTKFCLRPLELLQLFNMMGDYYRWFNFDGRTQDAMIPIKITSILLETCWINGLQRQIRVRKKAPGEF